LTIELPSVPETRPQPSKLMSAREAIAQNVHDGDAVFFGYTSWATALEWEVCRQRKQDLVSVGIMASSLLPLLGCARKIITAFLLGARSPWFMERMNAGEFQVEDYTNQSMALMFMAGALGLPFVPTRTMLGTDYVANRYYPQPNGFVGEQKFHKVTSPFNGEQALALPPLRPDVSCIHVQWADEEGNAVFWGGHGEVRWGLWASKRIVISAEEIVPAGVLRSDPHRIVVPGFMVNAVVHMPFGSLPYNLPGYYRGEGRLTGELMQGIRTPEAFERLLKEWIDGCPDHQAFLDRLREKYGDDVLETLRTDRRWKPARPIEYGWNAL
jgi:glutaconate CoA-transferase subunit A